MQIKLYRSKNVKWVKLFYPASVSYLYLNANEIVPKCKWNENVKWAFTAVQVFMKLCVLELVGAIPGCILAG
eukprot:452533-Rhodomonas_salina.1